MKLCQENKIEQRFIRIKTPRTNSKAERVIITIMEIWHNKIQFKSSVHRKQELTRFVNCYNAVKPHKGINNFTPIEKLINYFYPKELQTTLLILTNYVNKFFRPTAVLSNPY